jgi:drug/metabolite transporter (DMT)-like permease
MLDWQSDDPDTSDPSNAPPMPGAASAPPHAGWLAPVPLFFVVLWSTGFIAAKFGLPYAPPLTFLILRCLGVLLVLVPPCCWLAARPGRADASCTWRGRAAAAGRLPGRGLERDQDRHAGRLSALIVGMQPILTAFAAPLIGERVRPRQWLGLLLGLGGVALVVVCQDHLNGLSVSAIGYCVLALLSITAGTCTRSALPAASTCAPAP